LVSPLEIPAETEKTEKVSGTFLMLLVNEEDKDLYDQLEEWQANPAY